MCLFILKCIKQTLGTHLFITASSRSMAVFLYLIDNMKARIISHSWRRTSYLLQDSTMPRTVFTSCFTICAANCKWKYFIKLSVKRGGVYLSTQLCHRIIKYLCLHCDSIHARRLFRKLIETGNREKSAVIGEDF